jgi:signal peptidase II
MSTRSPHLRFGLIVAAVAFCLDQLVKWVVVVPLSLETQPYGQIELLPVFNAMILGGALGNIIDRVRFGYVVDFADLHFGAFRPFMIFNVADACITLGVLLLVARALLFGEKTPAAADQAAKE